MDCFDLRSALHQRPSDAVHSVHDPVSLTVRPTPARCTGSGADCACPVPGHPTVIGRTAGTRQAFSETSLALKLTMTTPVAGPWLDASPLNPGNGSGAAPELRPVWL